MISHRVSLSRLAITGAVTLSTPLVALKEIADAHSIVYDENKKEIFNFGKYKEQNVQEVLKKDPGYYGWMMNSDFPLYTKNVLTNIKLRAFGK